MKNNTMVLKYEEELLQYLCSKLQKGNTEGVSSIEYLKYINELIKAINSDDSEFAKRVETPESLDFFNTVNKAIELIKLQNKENKVSGLNVQQISYEKGIVSANYDFIKPVLQVNSIYPQQKKIRESLLDSIIESPDLYRSSNNKVSFETSKKVGAFYINNLVEKFIESGIGQSWWPVQCRDADQYIFKKDLARIINIPGSKREFKAVYINAIRAVNRLIEVSNGQTIMFSNNDQKLLAYANYMKMIGASKFSFLHNIASTNDTILNVSIIDNVPYYSESNYSSYDSYGDWNDYGEPNTGVINSDVVKTMEKRIRKVRK